MRLLAIILCALLAGCGVTYKLDHDTHIPPGKSYTQAISEQAGCVGAAVAVTSDDLDRQIHAQRLLYAECMQARGYRVNPPE